MEDEELIQHLAKLQICHNLRKLEIRVQMFCEFLNCIFGAKLTIFTTIFHLRFGHLPQQQRTARGGGSEKFPAFEVSRCWCAWGSAKSSPKNEMLTAWNTVATAKAMHHQFR